ncbi:hypothetical protein Cs7R123_13830 [Catellatospora sp. TT07R-123]|uniref:hypothetical protein n=1 Tax=Catellatospora sp. TT07R-123 TaxID=2733863 RepID=UPI001B0313AF|nr:hypothetical protein [Catellatospora sp. TT07R-123]GHJ44041.1 hypothetical protein Cs7R123_13830 [Catellatospora sp. TT07R-123]
MSGRADARDLPADVDLLALVRRFEPVLRFTAGELFFPMTVGQYLSGAALWLAPARGRGPAVLLVDHGALDPDALARAARQHPVERLFLRYAARSLDRRELRLWRRRPDRPAFHGVSRLAAVGLLGRFIDSGMRLSLVLRGRVPGGLVAAGQQRYAETGPPCEAYHAHVSTDGGYVVIQYWFLYAMNDWRSTFAGVNDHEADWEQLTLYLVDTGDGPSEQRYELAWVAMSSHDEVGDDLRRRPDDPDLTWVGGTHLVGNAGAGSHSGAYLPGDYLVRVQPPALARFIAGYVAVRSVLFPWTRGRASVGVGIPYVDYRRGDGVQVGPGTGREWTPVLIDSQTPWVRDYRGLWGLDTDDPFGGERAPAGPRYERSGAIRQSWADPVGWAGLDRVPPDAQVDAARTARVAELDRLVDGLDGEIADGQQELRRAGAGVEALPRSVTGTRHGGDGAAAQLAEREAAVAGLRARRRVAVNERDQLRQVADAGVRPDPHAHLRHRAVPDVTTSAGVLLRFWTGASLSILLLLLGVGLLLDLGPVLWVTLVAVLAVMAVEAVLRGRLPVFLLSLAIIAAIWYVTWLLLTNLRVAFGVLAVAAAVALGVANLRSLLDRR